MTEQLRGLCCFDATRSVLFNNLQRLYEALWTNASTGPHNHSTCALHHPCDSTEEVIIHWSWENNWKLRSGQAVRSRTLRATRGPPPFGSLIINETWGCDGRPWLNTKRGGAVREQGWAVRGGGGVLTRNPGYSPYSALQRRNSLHNPATLASTSGVWSHQSWYKQEVRRKDKGGCRKWAGGGLPCWREQKQLMEWKTAWTSLHCFPRNPAVPKLLSYEVCTCPGGTILPRAPLWAESDERLVMGGSGGLALHPPPSGPNMKGDHPTWYYVMRGL